MLFLLFQACQSGNKRVDEDLQKHLADSLSEIRIDSAYKAINRNCETLMVHRVPLLVKMLVQKDSLGMRKQLDSTAVYHDADKKVENVIRLLRAECDSSLLRETYKRWRLLQRPKPVRYKRKKA